EGTDVRLAAAEHFGPGMTLDGGPGERCDLDEFSAALFKSQFGLSGRGRVPLPAPQLELHLLPAGTRTTSDSPHRVQLQTLLHGQRPGEDAEKIDIVAPSGALHPFLIPGNAIDLSGSVSQLVLAPGKLQRDVLQIRVFRIHPQLLQRFVERVSTGGLW